MVAISASKMVSSVALGRQILGYMEKGIQNSHGVRPVNQDI